LTIDLPHKRDGISAARRRCNRPAATQPLRFEWVFGGGLLFYHLVAALAVFPYFFSWTGVILAVLGIYVFGVLGINLGYHRLLAHRSFECPKWLEHTFVLLAVCCLQDSPARWVAIHRRHHQYADREIDPHSPLVSFLWSHVGWILVTNDDLKRGPLLDRYAKDIMRDTLCSWLETRFRWVWIVFLSWFVFFGGGFVAEIIRGGSKAEAAQFGLSLLIWGVFVRTVMHLHFTWSVNSVTHGWGYRNYDTPDDSSNNAWIALISNGEGWHNNHHADPQSARHGHMWWEIDVAYWIIRSFAAVGLAWNISQPSPALQKACESK
jgi:stearoyl-CoA desaturase (delta-9 desaturase)